jgi:hypothetical protein
MFENHRTKIILIICSTLTVLFLGACVFLFVFVIQSSEVISGNSDSFQEAMQSKEKSAAIEKILDDTAAERKEIGSFILNSETVVEFINKIENLGRTVGLSLNVDSVGTVAATDKLKDRFEYISLYVSTAGSWAKSLDLLSALEHFPYELNLKQVVLTKQATDLKKNTGSVWNGNFTIHVLKLK